MEPDPVKVVMDKCLILKKEYGWKYATTGVTKAIVREPRAKNENDPTRHGPLGFLAFYDANMAAVYESGRSKTI